jgi:hypothetical protein
MKIDVFDLITKQVETVSRLDGAASEVSRTLSFFAFFAIVQCKRFSLHLIASAGGIFCFSSIDGK